MQNRLIARQQQCLLIQPLLAEKLGKTPSMFLQQLHYWITSQNEGIGKTINKRRWIYNSAKDWAEQLCLSERHITRIVSKLKNLGVLLIDHLNHTKADRTNWYSIDYQELERLMPELASPQNKKTTVVGEKKHPVSPPDKMSEPFGQNVGIYNKETEITSDREPLSSEAGEGAVCLQQVHGVEQDSLSINQDLNSVTDTSPPTPNTPSNNLASDLLGVWNQTVGQQQGEGGGLAQLTKKRAQHLVAAFKYRFDSSKAKWKQFCQQITSSDFLMGKVKSTFKASLDWVLKFDIIQRILEGDFGVKPFLGVNEGAGELVKVETLHQAISTSGEDEVIQSFRRDLLKAFGGQTYQSWFSDMEMIKHGKTIHLRAKSRFVGDYVQTHYVNRLNEVWVGVVAEGAVVLGY